MKMPNRISGTFKLICFLLIAVFNCLNGQDNSLNGSIDKYRKCELIIRAKRGANVAVEKRAIATLQGGELT